MRGVRIALFAAVGATLASLGYAQDRERSFSYPSNSSVLQYRTAPVGSSLPSNVGGTRTSVPLSSNPYPGTNPTYPTIAIPPVPANTNSQGPPGASQASYGSHLPGSSGYNSSLPAGPYAPSTFPQGPLNYDTTARAAPQGVYPFRCVVNAAGDYCTGAVPYVLPTGTACMCGQYNGHIQ